MNRVNTHICTVANGEQTSTVINLEGDMMLAVSLGAGVDSTAFTITTSMDGGTTYQTFYKDGADKSFTCASSKNVDVSEHRIIAQKAKIVMGSAETPAKTIYVTSLPLD